MPKKQKSPARARAQGGSKSRQSRGTKHLKDSQSPSQTRQPYEQDAKRRIGHYSGTGEPPLMKK
jgi:hypothetical protein